MSGTSISGQAFNGIQPSLGDVAPAAPSQKKSGQAAASPVEGQVRSMKAQAKPDSHAKAMLEFGAQASKDYAVGFGLSVAAAVVAATFPVSLLLYALWSSKKSGEGDDAQAKSGLEGVEGSEETGEVNETNETSGPTEGEFGKTAEADPLPETSEEHLRNLAEPAPAHHAAPLEPEDYSFPDESPAVTPDQVLTQADIARLQAQQNQRTGKPG